MRDEFKKLAYNEEIYDLSMSSSTINVIKLICYSGHTFRITKTQYVFIYMIKKPL